MAIISRQSQIFEWQRQAGGRLPKGGYLGLTELHNRSQYLKKQSGSILN